MIIKTFSFWVIPHKKPSILLKWQAGQCDIQGCDGHMTGTLLGYWGFNQHTRMTAVSDLAKRELCPWSLMELVVCTGDCFILRSTGEAHLHEEPTVVLHVTKETIVLRFLFCEVFFIDSTVLLVFVTILTCPLRVRVPSRVWQWRDEGSWRCGSALGLSGARSSPDCRRRWRIRVLVRRGWASRLPPHASVASC